MANKRIRSVSAAIVSVIQHRYFFVFIVALLILNAGWIALSANYPMIFDEQYHLGIIEIYSRQLSPFIETQPADAVLYRDVTRLPSYLFHWLMSFPYRLITLFTADFQAQVIVLRLINIAMVAASLVFWRKLLLMAGFSRTIAHTALLFFALIPLVAYTAANINYDNLVLLVLPLLFIAALKAANRNENQATWLLVTAGLGGLLTVIKYTTLPILVGVAVFILVTLAWQHRGKLLTRSEAQLKEIPKHTLLLITVLALVGGALFAERHIVNVVQYGSVNPSCEKIQPVSVCQQNDVWIRNYNVKQRYQEGQWELMSPYEFTKERWVPHIFNDLFVTAALVGGTTDIHQPVPPILETDPGNIVIRNIGWAAFWIGLLLTVIYWRKLPATKARYLFVGVLAIYAASLWLNNYSGYQKFGVPLATQGRYFILLLIPAMAVAASAFSCALRNQVYKAAVLIAVLVLFTQGAGAMTYIKYSWPTWHWQQGPAVNINERAKELLNAYIIKT